nr:universal stress protein [Streptomyces sp. SID5468]
MDGSPESLSAAYWGAREAVRRGLSLRLTHAWVLLSPGRPGPAREPGHGTEGEDPNYWAKRVVSDAGAAVHARHPDLPVVQDLVAEEPAGALLAAAQESRMLVLGSRGLGAVGGFFLGDTALHVAARAEHPVVLVRAATREEAQGDALDRRPVAVGLDLDRPGTEVADFAFETAAQRDVPLRVVHGRALPAQGYAPWGVDKDAAAEISAEAEDEVAEALRPFRERFPQVTVETVVRLESPARAVVAAASGAGLLVVGRHRRHGGVHRVGAVAQAAVHHATCPVAIVPHH